jgi:hypothetical protein
MWISVMQMGQCAHDAFFSFGGFASSLMAMSRSCRRRSLWLVFARRHASFSWAM